MKTIETANALSIEERAIEYGNKWDCPKPDPRIVRAYTAGAAEQKAIMLEEASKGFKEHWDQSKATDYPLVAAREAWQAATLSAEKNHREEIKRSNEDLSKSALYELDLKREIEELKKDLEWALDTINHIWEIERAPLDYDGEKALEIRQKHGLKEKM